MRATSLLPFWACILLLQSYNNVGVQSQRNRPQVCSVLLLSETASCTHCARRHRRAAKSEISS